jgi:hypothetical protein
MAVEIKKSNPLYNFTQGFIGIICISIVWCFYSVAIEILPMQTDFASCKKYNAVYVWNATEDKKCIEYLDTIQYYGAVPSTFWSIMILSGLMPWNIICMVAIITSHEKTDVKTKQYSWISLVVMMSAYFLTLLLSSWYGIAVYLYATPAFIGIPSIIGVPVYTYIMMTLNVCKPYLELINPLTMVTYFLIVSSIMVLASYIVWLPESYNDRRYKVGILLSCAYFFAWLGSLILALQIHIMYTFDGYKKPIRKYASDGGQEIQEEEKTVRNDITKYINLGTGLSFMMNMILISWLSITTSAANITILVLISVFPILCRLAVLGQNALYEYLY